MLQKAPDGICGLIAGYCGLPRCSEGLHLVNQHKHKGVSLLHLLTDPGEQARDELAGLAEVLAEEAVGVDLNQLAVFVPACRKQMAPVLVFSWQ